MTPNLDRLQRLRLAQARKYESLEILSGVREALDALGYLNRQAVSEGHDFSEHVEGLYHLQKAQSDAMKAAEEKVRFDFEQADVREGNWTLDALFHAAKVADHARREDNTGMLSSEQIRARADLIAAQVNEGKSAASIAAVMNLDERAVQWMMDQLRSSEAEPVPAGRAING